MRMYGTSQISALLAILLLANLAAADTIELTNVGLDKAQQDWGRPGLDKSVDGHPLSIGGRSFGHGVGSHASSLLLVDLRKTATHFTAQVGMDDEVKSNPQSAAAAVQFKVIGDGKTLFDSGRMAVGDPPKPVDVDLSGVERLALEIDPVSASIDFCHADWADAVIEFSGRVPVALAPPAEPAQILTPPDPPTPRINGARVLGVRPGHPALYTIAATGRRPMTFSAQGLPAGLMLDAQTGRISGSTTVAGESTAHLTATNALGSATAPLRIVVGERIALTPPMGWNSWNCFASAVSDKKVRAAADAMVASGLIDHGWTYINIDDCWEVRANQPPDKRRDADGHIQTNGKFPDMKGLADYIHAKGLRAGLYSSPGPSTCGGFTASHQFEEIDARQYAGWGFDYLKYDWCSYGAIADQIRAGPNPPTALQILQHPYIHMHEALLHQDRDIVFSLCQYGMGKVWEWGDQVGGNCWRTTGDINDSWRSMSGIGFAQNGHEKFAGPGHWNDPDMLVVGKVGWGPSLHPTHLTPNEQYTHITLWCLLSAPLLIGCDMTQLDDFTRGLLCNDEVLAVDQDPLGRPAARIFDDGQGGEIWARKMADGSRAVGLFNRTERPITVTVKWSDLGLQGKQGVRDLWRQKDLGDSNGQFSADVGRHGAVLLKISPAS